MKINVYIFVWRLGWRVPWKNKMIGWYIIVVSLSLKLVISNSLSSQPDNYQGSKQKMKEQYPLDPSPQRRRI